MNIHLDYGKAGTGEMFQIASIENSETNKDFTNLIDVGEHHDDIKEVIEEISEKLEISIDCIDYDIV
ncbi:MAG: hypothetical protein JJW00_00650 [Sulfurimonas sp.]|nr:hypothetical protein [Sulfurimonas sp.]